MKSSRLFGINNKPLNKSQVLEKIKKYIKQASDFAQIVSLNPENLVIANENKEFKKVIETAQIVIVDGFGVVLAGRLLNIEVGERITGVTMMEELLRLANNQRLRVLLIGGRQNLALYLSKCYSQSYPEAKFLGFEGVENVKKPLKSEEKALFSIVSDYKPHIIFAAFGSPDQELWLDRHKSKLRGIVCMGVGGAFDYASGLVPRAPEFLRKIGLEWLFRLLAEPWRWKRQLRLLKFLWLVVQEKFKNYQNH